MKKFIGKPYAGKPHVRIDEGEKRQRRFSLLYREIPLCESAGNTPLRICGKYTKPRHISKHLLSKNNLKTNKM
jgi:hypothetical protein